jgi:insertion element IS1 protein InsB
LVNYPRLEQLDLETLDVDLYEVEEAEMDEKWSFVGSKKQQRWLWHAIDHATGSVLAYVLAPHKDQALVKLVNLLIPFGIKRFFTDAWGAYERILEPNTHLIGKKNTQKIERKHLTLRTRIKRLARKTICYSKSIVMHDIVIGLFINRYEFYFQSSSCSQQM